MSEPTPSNAECADALRRAASDLTQGRFREAEVALEAIAANHPDEPDAVHLLGTLYLQTNRLDEAIATIRRAIEIKENNPAYHHNLGLAHQTTGSLAAAESAFRRAAELTGSRVLAEETTYDIIPTADEAASEYLYEHAKSFWFRRHDLPASDEFISYLLEEHRQSLCKPIRAKQAQLLREFCEVKLSENDELSLIEIGGANGTTLHYLKTFLDLERIKYLGIEPYDEFRKDFKLYFPNHTIVDSEAEKFCDLDVESLIETPVTAVLCSLILCMIPRRVASAFLKQAAQFTDNIIGLDYFFDFGGDTFPDARERVFKYNEECGQIYFVHKFGEYFNDIGFEAVKRIQVPHCDGMLGWETFHFQRRGC